MWMASLKIVRMGVASKKVSLWGGSAAIDAPVDGTGVEAGACDGRGVLAISSGGAPGGV